MCGTTPDILYIAIRADVQPTVGKMPPFKQYATRESNLTRVRAPCVLPANGLSPLLPAMSMLRVSLSMLRVSLSMLRVSLDAPSVSFLL
jgi:hypothetical protein